MTRTSSHIAVGGADSPLAQLEFQLELLGVELVVGFYTARVFVDGVSSGIMVDIRDEGQPLNIRSADGCCFAAANEEEAVAIIIKLLTRA